MKKVALSTTFIAAALMATSAFAEHHEGMHDGEGKKGHKGGKMFMHMDTDGDGVVSKAEFLAKSEERFAKMDADGDGKVTQEEAKAHRMEMKDKWKERKEKREEKKKLKEVGEGAE